MFRVVAAGFQNIFTGMPARYENGGLVATFAKNSRWFFAMMGSCDEDDSLVLNNQSTNGSSFFTQCNATSLK